MYKSSNSSKGNYTATHFRQESRHSTIAILQLQFNKLNVKMKSSMVLAGACLLALVFTIAECKLNLDIVEKQDITKRQNNCINAETNKCIRYAAQSNGDEFCDADCEGVFEDYTECTGGGQIIIDGQPKCGAAGLGSALLSIIAAVVVAATLN